MAWFLLLFFVALQVSAVVVALVARSWRIDPEPVVWRGIDVPNASAQVCLFIESVYDHRFAYPTGFFRIEDEAALDRGDVSMREANFKGSHGFSYIPRVFVWAHEVMRQARHRVARGGTSPAELFALFFMGWIVYGFAGVLAAIFAGVSVLDMAYRALYRSHIHATVIAHPTLDDAVEIKLRFQGLSAYGAIQDVLGGMATPTLPTAAGTALTAAPPVPAGGGADAPETETTRVQRMQGLASAAHLRFRVLYGTGIASALLVATLLALFVAPPSGTSESYAGGYEASSGYATSSSSSESESEDSSDESAYEEDASSVDDSGTDDVDDSEGVDAEQGAGYADSTVSSLDDPDTFAYPESDVEGRMERAVRRHWQARLDGDYTAALGLYGPALRKRAGAASTWTAQIRADGLNAVTIYSVDVTPLSDELGRVFVDLSTDSDAEGCKRWDFSYTVKKSAGRWMLWNSTVDDASC